METKEDSMIYRNYIIEPFPYGYTYAHKDYDGSPEYAYDLPCDIRSGFADSVDGAKFAIDDIEDNILID